MTDIAWEHYLELSPQAAEADIARVEQAFGVRFPDDFRAALRAHQGQVPAANILHAPPVRDATFGPLLHVSRDAEGYEADYAIEAAFDTWRLYSPQLVPIADSGGGNAFAYDYGADALRPPIVFINHEAEPGSEKALTRVAASLDELLGKLRAD
jgi:cell wall assembly regulator SMI1